MKLVYRTTVSEGIRWIPGSQIQGIMTKYEDKTSHLYAYKINNVMINILVPKYRADLWISNRITAAILNTYST